MIMIPIGLTPSASCACRCVRGLPSPGSDSVQGFCIEKSLPPTNLVWRQDNSLTRGGVTKSETGYHFRRAETTGGPLIQLCGGGVGFNELELWALGRVRTRPFSGVSVGGDRRAWR